ncbi:MAG: spermidine synthase [bacterium]|nr:spermidine synthase [bacterium]
MKARMYNNSTWINNTNPSSLLEYYKHALTLSGFDILNISEHHFKPQGYTALFLLSESHLAIHTFPEEETAYIELSSCIKEPFDEFIRFVK